jgi:hypothetical protein
MSEISARGLAALALFAGPIKRGRRIAWLGLSDAQWMRLSELAGTVDRASWWRSGIVQFVASLAGVIVILFTVCALLIAAALVAPEFMSNKPVIGPAVWLVPAVTTPLFIAGFFFMVVVMPMHAAAALAPTDVMRARLVPQPGDRELANKILRRWMICIAVTMPAGMALIVLAMMALVSAPVVAVLTWASTAYWLAPVLLLLALPLIVLRLRRARAQAAGGS